MFERFPAGETKKESDRPLTQNASSAILIRPISDISHARRVCAALQRELPARAPVGTMRGGPTYVERATEGTGMSPSEIRACYRLYAAHRRSHRPAIVEHFDHLRKMLASLAAQLFGRSALVGR